LKRDADLLVVNCGQLLTLAAPEGKPRVGPALADLAIVYDGALAAKAGKIVAVGKREAVEATVNLSPDGELLDAGGAVVLPGFVDCHTHTVFAKYRLDEYEWRVAGTPYATIAERGGGIMKSVADVHEMDEESLFAVSSRRLDGCMRFGTTTIEIKSGYGLDLKNEMKMLRVIRRLAENSPMSVVASFLGAHSLPQSYADKREEFIKLVINEMIPAVAAEGLAEYNDVFSETGVFTVEEAERILRNGQEAGLKARLHADELDDTGSAELAARIGAISADHLTKINNRGMAKMAEAGVFGVLLPGTSFGLPSLHFAPARKMIEAGMCVALASDFNPGSSTSESIPMMIAIACSFLHLSPSEAIAASTYNPAFVLGRNSEVGSLETGKRADFLVLNCEDYREIPNRFGINPVAKVYIEGKACVNNQASNTSVGGPR
jgi:imidazolonepropionase